jgi:serine/threonine protein kinase
LLCAFTPELVDAIPAFASCCVQGVVSEHEAATAMRCVLEALAALHAADVVYGDVKPANFVRTKVSREVGLLPLIPQPAPGLWACIVHAELLPHVLLAFIAELVGLLMPLLTAAREATRCVVAAGATCMCLHPSCVHGQCVMSLQFVRCVLLRLHLCLQHFPSLLHQIDSSQPRGDIDVKLIDLGTAQLCKDGCSVAEGISGTPGTV